MSEDNTTLLRDALQTMVDVFRARDAGSEADMHVESLAYSKALDALALTRTEEPPTHTPQAMTLEEGLAAIFPDTIGRRDDGKWPFFTYVNDEHGHTCTAIFDSWPEAVSWAKGVPVVARDDAAELRAAAEDVLGAIKHQQRDPAYHSAYLLLQRAARRLRTALEAEADQ